MGGSKMEVVITKKERFAGRQYDANGFPAKWASIHVYVFWDCKYQKYIIKEESYLGTGSASNKYESERLYDSVDEVNKALHSTREYADYYRQAYNN